MQDRALPDGVVFAAFLIHDRAEELSAKSNKVGYGLDDL